MSDKKIKILFRHRSMEMGGVEKVLLSLLNNLDKNIFDMTVCLNLNQGELRDQFPSHVRKVFISKGREDFSKNNFIQKIQLFTRNFKQKQAEKKPKIAQNILNEYYDVEIATTYAVYDAVLNSVNKKSKKIGWLHSDLSLSGFDPLRDNILAQLKKFNFIIYGSKQSKNVLSVNFPEIKLPQGQVVLNAIPIDELKRRANEFSVDYEGITTFVSVGRLHYRKGYKTLIEAHKSLLLKGFPHQIIIIGNGEDHTYLSNRAEELKIQDTFRLLGTLSNPYPYVKNADFYIMPSESEGWPLIIAETLILQKPIIATNVGGIPELITHKKNGYLINYNADEMCDAMKTFMMDKILITNIRKELKNSEKIFDNEKIFKDVETIILNLNNNQTKV